MGVKRGRGRGGFIDSILDLVDVFYSEVVQHLKAWSASPPRMREPVLVPDTPPVLVSTSLSSQNGPDESGSAEASGVQDSQQMPNATTAHGYASDNQPSET